METDFDFKKLYGKMTDTLKKGTSYSLLIENNWKGHDWDTEKRIFISEVNGLGGHNPWMGIYFLCGGFVSLIALIAYCVIYFAWVLPRNLKAKREREG